MAGFVTFGVMSDARARNSFVINRLPSVARLNRSDAPPNFSAFRPSRSVCRRNYPDSRPSFPAKRRSGSAVRPGGSDAWRNCPDNRRNHSDAPKSFKTLVFQYSGLRRHVAAFPRRDMSRRTKRGHIRALQRNASFLPNSEILTHNSK